MIAGQTVYRANVYVGSSTDMSQPFYMQTAKATGTVIDGTEMVRVHTILCPADEWHETEDAAKAAIRPKLEKMAAQLAAAIEALPASAEAQR